jgi:hypothetical protein
MHKVIASDKLIKRPNKQANKQTSKQIEKKRMNEREKDERTRGIILSRYMIALPLSHSDDYLYDENIFLSVYTQTRTRIHTHSLSLELFLFYSFIIPMQNL